MMRLLLAEKANEQATHQRKPFQRHIRFREQRIREALTAAGEYGLQDKIERCRRPLHPVCGSIYCHKCYSYFKNSQFDLATKYIISRYQTETEFLQNIRSVTVLHSIVPLINSGYHGQLEIQRDQLLKDVIKARRQFQNICKRNCPGITLIGGFELELFDQLSHSLMPKKSNTIEHLPGYQLFWPSDNISILHSHLMLDLNGTDIEKFETACKTRWPGPNQFLAKKLTNSASKPIQKSLADISKYPFKSQITYTDPKKDDPFFFESIQHLSAMPKTDQRPISDLPLAALITAISALSIKQHRILQGLS